MALALVPFVEGIAEVVETGVITEFTGAAVSSANTLQQTAIGSTIGTVAGEVIYHGAVELHKSAIDSTVNHPVFEWTPNKKSKYKHPANKRPSEQALDRPAKKHIVGHAHEAGGEAIYKNADNIAVVQPANYDSAKNLYQLDTSDMVNRAGPPKRQFVKHRYVSSGNLQLAPAGGGDKDYAWAGYGANFLENIDNVSQNNAALFSQYASFYDQYTVLSATIRVDIGSYSGTAANWTGGIVGIALKDDVASSYGKGTTAILGGDAIWKIIPTEGGVATLVAKVTPNEYFGIKNTKDNSTLRVDAAVTGDSKPINTLWFHIFHSTADGALPTTTGTDGKYTVTIDYDVMWSEPRMITSLDQQDPVAGGAVAVTAGL